MNKEELRLTGGVLRDGNRLRVSHDCGTGRTMLVSRDGDKVRGWCFRCNEGSSVTLHLSTSEHLKRAQNASRAAADAEHEGSTHYPVVSTNMADWPQAARLWMFSAGFTESDAGDLGIGWSHEMQRTVLPITERHDVWRTWTARAHDGRSPKYLTGGLPEGFVAETPDFGAGLPVVVTEDWLSALKLGRAGIHAVSMLGTYPKAATLLRLLELKEVLVWLDNDLPPKHSVNHGQIHAQRLCRALRAHGCKVTNIVSGAEPKQLSTSGLRVLVALYAAGLTPSASAQDGE